MEKLLSRYCFLLLLPFLYACDTSKHDLEIQDATRVQVEENAMVTSLVENILNEVIYNLSYHSLSDAKSDSMPLFRVEIEGESDHIYMIDYSNSNVTDQLGRMKRGQIRTHLSGEFLSNNCYFQVQFDQFYVNEMQILGTIDFENIKYVSNEILQSNVKYDLLLKDQNLNTYQLKGELLRDWIEGVDTDSPWDDRFVTTGTLIGETAAGESYLLEVQKPIFSAHSCEFIVRGEISLQVVGEAMNYSYGNEMCDNKGNFWSDNENGEFEFGKYLFRYNSFLLPQ